MKLQAKLEGTWERVSSHRFRALWLSTRWPALI